jgi:hypothetical protein
VSMPSLAGSLADSGRALCSGARRQETPDKRERSCRRSPQARIVEVDEIEKRVAAGAGVGKEKEWLSLEAG